MADVPKKPVEFDFTFVAICRWQGVRGAVLGVDTDPGFVSVEPLHSNRNRVPGVVIGNMGAGCGGRLADTHQPGIELRAKDALFTEGSRGHLGVRLETKYGATPQVYGVGVWGLWEARPERHVRGLATHAGDRPVE